MSGYKMIKEIYEVNKVINELYKLEIDKIKKISEKFRKISPELVLFVGRGSSDNACIYGQYLFQSKLRIPTSLALGSLYIYYKTPPDLRNSVVIGISQSGETTDVNGVLKVAKNENVFAIGITNNRNSTMSKMLGENTLYLNAGIEESVAATKTFVSSLATLMFLVNAICDENIRIDKLEELLNYVVNREEEIKNIAERFIFARDIVILGSGFNYSIALESALKLKETCYINAQGMSTVDFVHGPLAMLEPDIPVIVIAPDDGTLEVNKKVINKIKEIGAHTLLLSDNEEVLKEGDFSFKLLKTEKELYPFQSVMFMYLFSYYLSVSKKLNPDKPRFLNKISKI